MKTKDKILIIPLLVMGLIVMIANSCTKQKEQGQPPVLITRAVTFILMTTANSGGNISSDGGAAITARGVCWSTAQDPTVNDSKTTDGTGTGTFTSEITGLTATTTYYVKAYATNSAGTSYGDQLLFKTYTGSVTDADGNVYNTMMIGGQTWMAENMRTMRYFNGDLIGTTSSSDLDLTSESTAEYQWAFDGNESNVLTYGRLYTWNVIMDARNISPAGWHIPSDADWQVLANSLGGEGNAGEKLKEMGLVHWQSPNAGATDESGFGALPSGYRGMTGTFAELHQYSPWWSSTEVSPTESRFWSTSYTGGELFSGYYPRQYGYAVRCLKN